MIKRLLTLFSCLIILTLVGCGQEGALYLPGHDQQHQKDQRK